MINNKIKNIITRHSQLLLFFMAAFTSYIVYSNLLKLIIYITIFITLLYCLFFIFKDRLNIRKILIGIPILSVIFFYIFISFSGFYPGMILPDKDPAIVNYTGWNYYNFMTASLKKGKVSFLIEPSEKLKALDNPYDSAELNNKLSLEKFDYILDLSFYKDKYYLYFGITPILIVYLPFNILTKYFITDSLVVLAFSILSFLVSLMILKKILDTISKNKDFLLIVLTILAVGFSSAFGYLITLPRVYEVAIIVGLFFVLLSFLMLLFYSEAESAVKKRFFLFAAGLSIALSVGCRPFYALIVLFQIPLVFDFKTIKKNYTQYLYYFIPLIVFAIVLMIYNYLRFDSFFEFGHKFQLTLIDVYNRKFNLADSFYTVRLFFFFPPISINTFPYYLAGKIVIAENLIEPLVGLLYTAPYLLFIAIGSYGFFTSKKISVEIKKYTAMIILSGIMVISVVSIAGGILRYIADFAMYFIIPAFVMIFYWNERHEGVIGYFWRYFIMLLIFLSIIFSIIITISKGLLAMSYINPEVLQWLKKIL